MTLEFTQALEIISLLSVACIALSPILVWVFTHRSETA